MYGIAIKFHERFDDNMTETLTPYAVECVLVEGGFNPVSKNFFVYDGEEGLKALYKAIKAVKEYLQDYYVNVDKEDAFRIIESIKGFRLDSLSDFTEIVTPFSNEDESDNK